MSIHLCVLCVSVAFFFQPAETRGQSFYNFRDGFLDRKGSVTAMDLRLVEQTNTTMTFDFLLHSSRNDSLSGRLRMPKGTGPFPVAILAVGIETGKEVVDMIEGRENVILLGVDYPFEGDWDFAGFAAINTTFRLRAMGFRTVPLLMNCVDWLYGRREVDRSDISMITVSFGSFAAIPAAVIDPRITRLVVVQGGADLSLVIAHNAKRWGTTMPAWLAGWLGGAILAPFEPSKYILHLSPRPLLIINGKGDSFFPAESATRLFEISREPKEMIWHQSDHVMPGEKELIKELTNIVAGKLYNRY
jgi:hypothetical protein